MATAKGHQSHFATAAERPLELPTCGVRISPIGDRVICPGCLNVTWTTRCKVAVFDGLRFCFACDRWVHRCQCQECRAAANALGKPSVLLAIPLRLLGRASDSPVERDRRTS